MNAQRPRNKGERRIVIGVTGGFGSGKTTVSGVFESLGARVIDADNVAHRLLRRNKRVYRRIVSAFGTGILKKGKEIDRAKLATLVFASPDSLKKINRITHPEIIREIGEKIRYYGKKEAVVLDAPLLIEAGLANMVDKLVVVNINRNTQIERLYQNTSLDKADILRRIRSQIPLSAKVRMADFVIDNNGAVQDTRKQVKMVWNSLKENKKE
jgi:dephospho-CoA kinase